MDILSKGVSDRNAFLYLYYFKVFCVEEGIGSATEANNILAVAEPKSLVDDCLKDETKDHAANMFKYMHEHAP